MDNVILKDNIKIENMIHEVRGKQVMLSFRCCKIVSCRN